MDFSIKLETEKPSRNLYKHLYKQKKNGILRNLLYIFIKNESVFCNAYACPAVKKKIACPFIFEIYIYT